MIYNGYLVCKLLQLSLFRAEVWEAVDDVFKNYRPYLSLPKPLKVQMKNLHLNPNELRDLIHVREKINMYTNVI